MERETSGLARNMLADKFCQQAQYFFSCALSLLPGNASSVRPSPAPQYTGRQHTVPERTAWDVPEMKVALRFVLPSILISTQLSLFT
jgi:hypothetical protein